MKPDAFLALEDGTVYRGFSCGAPVDRLGEVVFNTGMTGYEEVLTDPSYAGQIVTFTVPELGNTGFNRADRESAAIHASGMICRDLNPPSSWRSEEPLSDVLRRAGIPAISVRSALGLFRVFQTIPAGQRAAKGQVLVLFFGGILPVLVCFSRFFPVLACLF